MKTPLKCAAAALSMLGCACPAAARDKAGPPQSPSAPLAERPGPSRLHFDTQGPTSARFPLAQDVDVGIGLYSVTGHFVRDRGARGREPIADPQGRENRVAAVGFSLRF